MRILTNRRAVSTFILIILMLCSVVFGAFLSYMWVMSNFYLEPENTVNLVITEANFPVDHADSFNVTIMNPSHSPYGTNITRIYLTAGNESINVTDTYPELLPIFIERGTVKTINCLENWGKFAGNTITVHVSGNNASETAHLIKTQFTKLEVQTYFNATESIRYFNVTVKNDANSAINLTLNKVYIDKEAIENMTLALPAKIVKGESITFRCFFNWLGRVEPNVEVKTLEGYTGEIKKKVSSLVILEVKNVVLNEANSSEFSITFFNSADSATLVDITDISLKYDNTTEKINGSLANPSLPYRLGKNSTVTFNCLWSWGTHRDKDVSITAHTMQGFISIEETVKTPKSVIFKITDLSFNLANTGYFLLNVTNMPSSLQNITITNATVVYGAQTIKINQTTPAFPYNITIGETKAFNCTFDWSKYKGKNVTVNVYISQGNASYNLTLPIVTLNATFNSSVSTQYFSIIIQNNAPSTININGINVNGTWVNATFTYPSLPVNIENGKALLILCPFDWQPLSGKEISIIVTTSNGFELTTKVIVP